MSDRRRTALIAYYSETGNTRAVAEALDRALDSGYEATVERIVAPLFKDRQGFWLFAWRVASALFGATATIAPPRHDPAGFDLVVLASPVWCGRLSTPMRGYLWALRGRFRNVAFVTTQAGTNPGRAFTEFAKYTGRPGYARLWIGEDNRRSHDDAKKIADFADMLLAQAAED